MKIGGIGPKIHWLSKDKLEVTLLVQSCPSFQNDRYQQQNFAKHANKWEISKTKFYFGR